MTVLQTVLLLVDAPQIQSCGAALFSACSVAWATIALETPLIAASIGDLGFTSLLAEAEAVAPAAGEGEADLTLFQQILDNPMVLMMGLFMIFYFTFLRPERRRKAAEAEKMSLLKKNDRVVTVGGIHGVIVAASPDSDVITLKIDESGNTRIKVNRSAIATVATLTKESKDKQPESDAKD